MKASHKNVIIRIPKYNKTIRVTGRVSMAMRTKVFEYSLKTLFFHSVQAFTKTLLKSTVHADH